MPQHLALQWQSSSLTLSSRFANVRSMRLRSSHILAIIRPSISIRLGSDVGRVQTFFQARRKAEGRFLRGLKVLPVKSC